MKREKPSLPASEIPIPPGHVPIINTVWVKGVGWALRVTFKDLRPKQKPKRVGAHSERWPVVFFVDKLPDDRDYLRYETPLGRWVHGKLTDFVRVRSASKTLDSIAEELKCNLAKLRFKIRRFQPGLIPNAKPVRPCAPTRSRSRRMIEAEARAAAVGRVPEGGVSFEDLHPSMKPSKKFFPVTLV